MRVLTYLKARGIEDVLIMATDNLNGFTQTIRSVFLESQMQIYVIHQIRNACKYVVWKDRKEFSADMKHNYTAQNKDAVKAALDVLPPNGKANICMPFSLGETIGTN